MLRILARRRDLQFYSLLLLLLPPLYLILSKRSSVLSYVKALVHRPTCVYAASTIMGEGLGEQMRRNQLAVFLAAKYKAKLSYPNISTHGYKLTDFYDICPQAAPECTIDQRSMVIPRCPRADCACLYRAVAPFLRRVEVKSCPTIAVKTDRLRTMEYSGCLRPAVERYFTFNKRPRKDFDVLHYRIADAGGKKLSVTELYFVLDAMCRSSDRDVIVLTVGKRELPNVPSCRPNRLVLAGNATVRQAFGLIAHAKTVSVASSTFALLMMEIARPSNFVILERNVYQYDWVKCENWTVVSDDGVPHLFTSKKLMYDTVLGTKTVKYRKRRSAQMLAKRTYKMVLPKRYWNVDDYFE